MRVRHALRVPRIDAKIAALQQREPETERGRRNRPRPPDWIVQLGIGVGRPPTQVHAGDCHMAGKRRRAVGRDEARRLLAAALRACSHCEPDTQLNILHLQERRPRRFSADGRTATSPGVYGGMAQQPVAVEQEAVAEAAGVPGFNGLRVRDDRAAGRGRRRRCAGAGHGRRSRRRRRRRR